MPICHNFFFYALEEPNPTTTSGSATFKGSYHNLIQFLPTIFEGTAIDYYTISFSGPEFKETYSIVNTSGNLSIPTWLHNATKLNVTAHNCAGQSDPVTLYIFHGVCMVRICLSARTLLVKQHKL